MDFIWKIVTCGCFWGLVLIYFRVYIDCRGILLLGLNLTLTWYYLIYQVVLASFLGFHFIYAQFGIKPDPQEYPYTDSRNSFSSQQTALQEGEVLNESGFSTLSPYYFLPCSIVRHTSHLNSGWTLKVEKRTDLPLKTC